MNLFKKIGVAVVGMAMAIGVGVAVASGSKEATPVHAANADYVAVSLSENKEVLIVSHDSSGNYYLMDAVTTATNAGPKWISCSLSNGKISGDYDSHLFTVSASSSNWKFASGSKYLKWSGTSSNTAIRINTGDSNNTWTYSSGTMKFSSATRYLGVYTAGTDWRSYNSSTADNYNGTGGNIEFYEKTASKTVSSVDVQTQPTKTEYRIGETFDPTGLVVRVTYTDSTHDDVAYSGANSAKFAFTGFDSSSATNDQQITVKYTPTSDQFTCATKVVVDVIEVSANAVLVDASSMNKTYRVGQTLDLTDLVIVVGFTDNSDEEYTIESNSDFTSRGFVLKLSGSVFDLSTSLTMEHNGASFVVYLGELNDDSDTIDIAVENIATLSITDFGTTKFYRTGAANTYSDSWGVTGSGSYFGAFEGLWYVNSSVKAQMNKKSQNCYFENVIPFGRIKTITVTTNTTNGSQFSMYYGNEISPNTNKITIADASSATYTYDFSAQNASFFRFAKDAADGNTYVTGIAIDFIPNDSLDRTEAGAYSDYFLATTSGLCDADGIENGVSGVWTKLSGVYTLLSSATKASLKTKALAEKGTPDATTVGDAMARYYWAVKNHDNTDFIGDGDIKAATNVLGNLVETNKGAKATIIVIISLMSFVALGGFFMLKKKKEQ